MKLIPNWRSVLRKAWSVRLMVVVTLCGCMESLLPYWSDSMPRGIFAGLSVLVSLVAMAARLVAQKGLSDAE